MEQRIGGEHFSRLKKDNRRSMSRRARFARCSLRSPPRHARLLSFFKREKWKYGEISRHVAHYPWWGVLCCISLRRQLRLQHHSSTNACPPWPRLRLNVAKLQETEVGFHRGEGGSHDARLEISLSLSTHAVDSVVIRVGNLPALHLCLSFGGLLQLQERRRAPSTLLR